jgi:hypothetical protein
MSNISQILQQLSDSQLVECAVSETAKSINEVKCALGDLDKAISRLRFSVNALEHLKGRTNDETQ